MEKVRLVKDFPKVYGPSKKEEQREGKRGEKTKGERKQREGKDTCYARLKELERGMNES